MATTRPSPNIPAAQAVDLINSRSIAVSPMITAPYALEDALAAFEAAGDRSRSVKVQLAF
ncbi:hypothetical protein [Hoeflea sp.]|uniref:hypothetical protein n=1 Tax=Hoeflea sp. TaxID=1940281 RepID=UPI003A907A9A